MLLRSPNPSPRLRCVIAVLAALGFVARPAIAQHQPSSPSDPQSRVPSSKFSDTPVTVQVHVLNTRGLPLDDIARVRLAASSQAPERTVDTQDGSVASFPSVLPGDYALEISSPGFTKSSQSLHVVNSGKDFPVFVYLRSENETRLAPGAAATAPVPRALQHEIDKGLDDLQHKQFEKAKAEFEKAARIAPNSSDVWYLRGNAELGLQNTDAAEEDFQQAITIEPTHEKALLALAKLSLDDAGPNTAILYLQTAYRADGAGWRTLYLLAIAYSRIDKLPEAEIYAERAVSYAGRNAADPMLLLADILYRENKTDQALLAWQRITKRFPKSPQAAEASAMLVKAGSSSQGAATLAVDQLPLPKLPELEPARDAVSWAPPDIDQRDYATADNITCQPDEVLDLAEDRLKSQLLNFEKFTATEHIVHTEIESSGLDGPSKEKKFSYIVFVYPYAGNSLYLEESRDGGTGYATFPTALATVGLNSLGVSLLQPINREGFIYTCEGLANINGQAAWQLRFEEKKNTITSIRRWRTNKGTYNVRVKGRVWLAATSYDMIQVETDLLEPVPALRLTRDHLEVHYGPVAFQQGKESLWLPRSADMYMELNHKRYHHRHFLTDYMLFGVDETQKVGTPKLPPPDPVSK